MSDTNYPDQDEGSAQWFPRSPGDIDQERRDAEFAGREAYADAIRSGQDVQASTPAELVALGRARLSQANGAGGQTNHGGAAGTDKVPQPWSSPIAGAPDALAAGSDAAAQSHQSLDPIIEREVARYNKMNQADPGDDVYLDPDLVRAMITVESGHDPKAYASDPMQVNKNGDWVDDKADFGLKKGLAPGPDLSVRAGLGWLDSKSYYLDNKGNPGPFIGYEKAVTRYNGGGNPNYWNDVQSAYRRIKSGAQ